MNDTTTSTESWKRFVLWAIDQVGLSLSQSEGFCRVAIPVELQPAWDGREEFCFSFDSDDEHERLGPDSSLLNEIIEHLQAQGLAVNARPADQPRGVHEIAQQLFDAYTVDGGSVHLAGCGLEDRAFVRLTWRTGAADDPFGELYVDDEGQPVDEAIIRGLGIRDLVPFGPAPPRIPRQKIQTLMDWACRWAQMDPVYQESRRVATTLVWCKYASGKLQFTIGDASLDVPFAGWAKTLSPPPVTCPRSQVESFHLAATDDGRMAAFEEITACEKSGRRMLRAELLRCSVTGSLVAPELTSKCPVSGDVLLTEALTPCRWCQELVAPQACVEEICTACGTAASVPKEDSRMARLLGEHPRLDRWPRWKLAETATVYIAIASSVMRQLLVVFDRQTLELRHAAEKNRLARNWSTVSSARRDELLQD